MIINKSQFKFNKKYRGKWPFTVDQVAVLRLQYDGINFYALIHNYHAFALSGGLESKGFQTLEDSGIWADNDEKNNFNSRTNEFNKPFKKSLTPFFNFIAHQVDEMDGE
jgi:hypothetical protein